MATNNPADLTKMQSEALKVTSAAAAKTLEGFQRLAALNMETAKASLEESSEQISALLAANDPKTLADLVTSFAKLSPEKFTAYANAVYAISSETSSEIGAMVRKQIAESNQQLAAAVESLAKQPPGGSGSAVDFITQSMNATRSAYEAMQNAAQQFAQNASNATRSATGGAGSAGGSTTGGGGNTRNS
ncbi:MAG: TIGR01841 family phasin [Gammaproteobacteria bacterium]